MNRKMVFKTVGLMLKVEAALLLLPILTALIYRESCIWPLLASAAIAMASGFALTHFCRPESQVIYAREGFAIVSLTWLASMFRAFCRT